MILSLHAVLFAEAVSHASISRSASGTAATTTYLFVMQAGMWVGYVTFGFISDRIIVLIARRKLAWAQELSGNQL